MYLLSHEVIAVIHIEALKSYNCFEVISNAPYLALLYSVTSATSCCMIKIPDLVPCSVLPTWKS